jgi:cellobiose phosphorylase
VLSGAGDPGRARGAMDAVDARLVRRDEKIVQLLTPAFNHGGLDPGYIQGYVPGVRENGGQYTHAAVWTAMAFAALGDARRAFELAMMISPLLHGATPEEIAKYKVEPYVVAADVYALPPHTGRGGWSWYTGSAGWMYRLLIESLLGLRLDVDRLRFAPCVPDAWTTFRIDYRYRETLHRITIVQVDASEGRLRVVQDGVARDDDAVQLFDDRNEHTAEVRIPRRPRPAMREPAPVAGELA